MRVRRSVVVVAVVIAALTVWAAAVSAAPGELDPSFATGGIFTSTFGAGNVAGIDGVAIQADGSIILAGFSAPADQSAEEASNQLVVARLTPSGILDKTFGTGGIVTSGLGGVGGAIRVAVDNSGRLVVLANTLEISTDTAGEPLDLRSESTTVFRFTAAGAVDSSFGSGGTTTVMSDPLMEGQGLALDSTGRILVAGAESASLDAKVSMFVSRLTADGNPDTKFGSGGTLQVTRAGGATGIAMEPDGTAVASATAAGHLAVIRVTSAGALDASFGNNGMATWPNGAGADIAGGIAVQPDGRSLVVGLSGSAPIVARFQTDGKADPTFGVAGAVNVNDPGSSFFEARGIAVESNGDIVIGGSADSDLAAARLLPSGRRDKTFGTGGISDLSAVTQGALVASSDLAVQGDGDLIVGGASIGLGNLIGSNPSSSISEQALVARILGGTGPATAAPLSVNRYAGPDRISTALAISQATFPSGGFSAAGRAPRSRRARQQGSYLATAPLPFSVGGSGDVVLASADNWPDAVVGGPLAAEEGAPLLLTHRGTLDPRVLAEVRRVLGDGAEGGTVQVLGGTSAISDNVVGALADQGYQIQRLAGVDRYATAVDVAEQGEPGQVVLEATGTDFADALSAGAAAAHVQGAVVLTNGGDMPAVTYQYLTRNAAVRVAVGGLAADADPAATPIVGADRYETSRLIAQRFFSTPGVIGIATGTDFADALSGGVRAGVEGGVLLLTPPSSPGAGLSTYLTTVGPWVRELDIFGGTSAVSAAVQASIQQAIG